MFIFARKPGINAYWVKEERYTLWAGKFVCLENLDVTGYGRFQRFNLVDEWNSAWVKVFKDGDHWCALRGPNIQEGDAVFSRAAMHDGFDQVTEVAALHRETFPSSRPYDSFVHYWSGRDIDLMAKQVRGLVS